jgi:O-antigen ligase/tetratricopeptide (TPR) repeat protein
VYEHQRWLYAGVLVALGMWLLAFSLQPAELRVSPPIVPALLVPVVAALLLGAVQIIPSLQRKLPALRFTQSKISGQADSNSLGRLPPELHDELRQRSQVSLYPASTRLELGKLTIGAAAFLAGLGLFPIPRMQRLLWLVLALNGAALAVFGIVQKLSWNEKIYWRVPLTLGGQPFAAFVNRNNAAGYLNLCLGAALGFAMWAFWKPTSLNAPGLRRTALPTGRPARFGMPQPQHFLAILLCVLILAGVCASLSRGGTIAMVIALFSALALLAFQRGAKVAAWTASGGLALCAALLGWLGLSSGFANRLSTLFDERVGLDARWMNWQTAWRAVHDFPILGTGFGTYRYAYQPYQTVNVKLWFYNADNHYVEGLTEGGLVGLLLIGVCIALMFRAFWVLVRRSAGGTNDPLVYVALFVLLSQCIQAGSDFGISVPANLMTFATICGVVVGEAARRCVPQRPPLSIALPVWQPRLVIGTLSVALLLNGALAVEEVCAATVAKAARSSLPLLMKSDSLSEPRLQAAIKNLTSAVRRRPDDAELRQVLGDLWIYRFRQETYRHWERKTAETPEVEPPNWNAIGLISWHNLAIDALQKADVQTLEDLRETPFIKENLRPARRHLLAARAACPLHPGIGLNLAMSDFLDDVDPSGTANIERAVALAPVNEDVLFTAGLLAERASQHELSRQYWARSLSLGHRHQAEVVDLLLDTMPFSELVDRVLPASPAILLELARTRFSGKAHESERRSLVLKSQSLLESDKTSLPDAQRCYWSGVAERLSGQADLAIILYQKAVTLQPDEIEWRMEFAQALREAGRIDDAVREARRCARMSPETPGVDALLQDLAREQVIGPNRHDSTTIDSSPGSRESSSGTGSK